VTEVDLAARFKVRIAPVVQLVDASWRGLAAAGGH